MKISVVIPCCNREDLIGRAIESALAQSHLPAEVIVVDDGSSDRSVEVMKCYDTQVRLIQQENRGAAAARNVGIKEATGDWIAFLDSDDVWHERKLERQLAAAKQFPEASVIFCDTESRRLDSPSLLLMPSRFALGGLDDVACEKRSGFACYGRSLFPNLLTRSRVITSAVMVRNGLNGLEFPEHIWGAEDWALWLNLILEHQFVAVREVLVTMFQQNDNLTLRKGRLHENDVLVLEELLSREEFREEERRAVQAALSEKRATAAYQLLVEGHGGKCRQQLKAVDQGEISAMKKGVYWATSYLPSGIVKQLAKLRGIPTA
ncbi:glycosyltransferase family 2 protein [Calycomorphotria hydatis]|uniref:UDP-Glc:alpha-D-GlcNAc-diphosphoundecaprenol beta-1,3-glucosyltransferase WfgD n=1 Tax=Calycomorphotria hydatis TaxID=2528027 RepID=A0A517T3H7_9PLAN|nr:glycosyltransferase family 2 protein [Calycomorphotria hydatis]QDT62891.1 UDP-Glc:alpha-D-GlcNAc-diphosphoundecaprenol beta-1,3-glucosyltransferase WfgD [Calycomorphotria hydatis]